jgi:hypothetical protein
VDDVVELGHQIRRIQRPPRIRPPPLTKSIQSGNASPIVKKPISVSATIAATMTRKARPNQTPAPRRTLRSVV